MIYQLPPYSNMVFAELDQVQKIWGINQPKGKLIRELHNLTRLIYSANI